MASGTEAMELEKNQAKEDVAGQLAKDLRKVFREHVGAEGEDKEEGGSPEEEAPPLGRPGKNRGARGKGRGKPPGPR